MFWRRPQPAVRGLGCARSATVEVVVDQRLLSPSLCVCVCVCVCVFVRVSCDAWPRAHRPSVRQDFEPLACYVCGLVTPQHKR